MTTDFFDRLPLIFGGLSPNQKDVLRSLFIPVECFSGTVLFEQGDPAEHLFLVVSGEVVIRYKPDDGPAITVARVHPGSVVGWSAALGNPAYTSGAICETYTQMLRVRGADLRGLCTYDPDTGYLILERLAKVIAERLRKGQEQVLALLLQGLRNGMDCVKEENHNGRPRL